MLTEYIRVAMRRAHFEFLDDEGEEQGYWATIPPMPGLWARGATLEAAREELQEVLEDWIVIHLQQHWDLPAIDGVDVAPEQVAVSA